MENYPSNTKTAVIQETRTVKKTTEAEPKQIKRIVDGEKVIRRKTPLGRKFLDYFTGGDARGAGEYVLLDVLVPAAKDAIADSVSQYVERRLFGEARSTSRRTGHKPSGGSNGFVSYNRYSDSGPRRSVHDDRPPMSRRARATHDFRDIVIPTRVEAEAIIDQMFELISKFEVVSVSELYDMIGETASYTDEKYGWTDIRGARVTRIRGGYLLDLPKPEQID